jgi:hypothetical protein
MGSVRSVTTPGMDLRVPSVILCRDARQDAANLSPSATAEVQRRLQDLAWHRPGKATAELDGGAGALAEGA